MRMIKSLSLSRLTMVALMTTSFAGPLVATAGLATAATADVARSAVEATPSADNPGQPRKVAEDAAKPTAGASEAAPAADKILPLAGVTASEARRVLEALAKRHNLPVDQKALEENLKILANGQINCDRLGLLCGVVGRERVPGIIRAAWAVQARGGDFDETSAAFDKAVTAAAQENAVTLEKEGARLEAELNQAFKDKKIDPKDSKQIQQFAASHAPAVANSFLNIPGLGAGAHISCDSQSWSDTSGWPWNWKFRRLSGCGGDIWGEFIVNLGWWGTFGFGHITVASVSTYTKGLIQLPASATVLKTTNTFQTHTASASTGGWFVTKMANYFYIPPKYGSWTAYSYESGVTTMTFTHPLTF